MRSVLLTLSLFFFAFTSLEASVDRRPACYKDLEKHFFDRTITSNALSFSDVKRGAWTAMIDQLQKISRDEVPQRTWKEGQKMQPNPLDTFYNPDLAGIILGKVLFDVFQYVCKEYNVTSPEVIRIMFAYIEQEQAVKIRKCFQRDTFMPKKDEEVKS